MANAAKRWKSRGRGSEQRASAHARGYDKRWAKLAQRFKECNPVCVDCLRAGLVTPSTEVHHVDKVQDRPERRYDWENLMALCKRCHAARTARGE